VLFVKGWEVILDNGSLTGTSWTHIEHTFLGWYVNVEKESLSSCLGCWNN
jgi:hypothetical protein